MFTNNSANFFDQFKQFLDSVVDAANRFRTAKVTGFPEAEAQAVELLDLLSAENSTELNLGEIYNLLLQTNPLHGGIHVIARVDYFEISAFGIRCKLM